MAVTPRPFLKWVGGKGQLLDQLLMRVPQQFGAYHEPFLGGGAMYFALYRKRRVTEAFLSDLNSELIDTYRAIRDCPEQVLARLARMRHTENFFYRERAKNPKRMKPVNRAARMIYLNKTCYNGLYRVNSSGGFNAPFGSYKNPNFRDVPNIEAVAKALQPARLAAEPFECVLHNAERGDLVYFDPPYMPLSETANFTAYHSNGFGLDDHIKLRDVACRLTQRGCYVMLSNSATQAVRDLYEGHFKLSTVYARRHVNSKANGRGPTAELLITNF